MQSRCPQSRQRPSGCRSRTRRRSRSIRRLRSMINALGIDAANVTTGTAEREGLVTRPLAALFPHRAFPFAAAVSFHLAARRALATFGQPRIGGRSVCAGTLPRAALPRPRGLCKDFGAELQRADPRALWQSTGPPADERGLIWAHDAKDGRPAFTSAVDADDVAQQTSVLIDAVGRRFRKRRTGNPREAVSSSHSTLARP